MEPNRSGNPGLYFRVLNWASEYGLSSETCGRPWLRVTSRSMQEVVHRLGNHGRPAIRVQGQVAGADAVPDEVLAVELLGDVLVLLVLDGPAHHQAAEQVDGHVELVAGAARPGL